MDLLPCHILRSKSPSYPGVDLRAARLRGEGGDGTTWHWRYLHGRLSLTKRLNHAAKKSELKLVELSPSRTVLSVGMGDGTATRRHGEWHVSIVPQ
jgi:hypothetical protein